jgi:hypothetical protein
MGKGRSGFGGKREDANEYALVTLSNAHHNLIVSFQKKAIL